MQEVASSGQERRVYWLEEGEEVRDGRAERSSAIRDEGQVPMSLMPNVDSTGFDSLLDAIQFYLSSWKNNPMTSG